MAGSRTRFRILAGILMPLLLVAGRAGATEREVLGGHEGWLDRMGGGVRELGFGNAGTALEDAAPATYWNPALLPFNRRPAIGFGADMRTLQRNGGFAALQGRVASNMGMGVGVLNRGDYDVPAYDSDERYIGTARPQAVATFIGLGFKTSRRNSLGAAVQWYSSNMDIDGRTGNVNLIGIFNFGWYRAWSPSLRTALVIRNVGANERLSSDFEQITLGENAGGGFEHSSMDFFPKTVVAAATYDRELWGRPWRFGLELMDYQLKDALFVVDRNFHHVDLRAGAEARLYEPLWVRGGYDRGNMSLGFTYAYRWGKRPILFDYAVTAERGLVHINPLAFGVRFEL